VTVVLDTHAWLWWLHDPSRLSPRARAATEEAERTGTIVVSAISIWEIAWKCHSGRLALPGGMREWFAMARSYPGISIEPISAEDAIASVELPGEFHKDPADRMIVALARRFSAPLISLDSRIRTYGHVRTVW